MPRRFNIEAFREYWSNYSKEDLITFMADAVSYKQLDSSSMIIKRYHGKKLYKMPKYEVEVTPEVAPEVTSKYELNDAAQTCLTRPYTLDEAIDLFEQDSKVEGVVHLDNDELYDGLGVELKTVLLSKLIDKDSADMLKDTDITVVGCDDDGLFMQVSCLISPCKNGIRADID